MSDTVITVEHLSKSYRLGAIGGETLRADVSRWLAKLSGKTDPTLKIGQEDHARLNGKVFHALNDVSFEVKQGEILGVIGRNGAGKSTLLKILSRVTAPTSGEVRIKGRVASLLEVGTGFHPELTGRENIFLNGAILGMTRAEIRNKFDYIVDFSGVEDFIDTPVKRYSSGMYVRLAFAVAAHLEPEILIVDEVLAVGDMEFQKKCLGKMQDVAGHGRTVLFVSHNMAAVTSLTSRCIVLCNGSVQYIGGTESAVLNYLKAPGSTRAFYRSSKVEASTPFVSKIRIDSLDGDSVHISGKEMTIIFELRHDSPIKSACFSFQIMNQAQQPVIHCWVYDSETPICRTNGKTVLKCRINRLALNVGSYSLTTHLSEPPGGAFFETLEGVCEFNVEMLGKQTLFGWRPNACAYIEEFKWENA
jgi:lipopolysaccharide transport system ATP-binding protein